MVRRENAGLKTSSKGNLTKWHDKENNCWYKKDGRGYEALAECIASDLLEGSNIDFVRYSMFDKGICCSNSFLNKDEEYVTVKKVIDNDTRRKQQWLNLNENSNGDNIQCRVEFIVDLLEHLTCDKEIGQKICAMLEFDKLIFNEDRHLHNFGLIRNSCGEFRLAPVFDNGAGFLSDLIDYPIGVNIGETLDFVKLMRAKPFCSNFDRQVKVVTEMYGKCLNLQNNNINWDYYSKFYSDSIIYRVKEIIDNSKPTSFQMSNTFHK